ncbi:putative phage abortive infection protein [Longitalea luteola]|uniref:putative phage abortive infection protein n=1 Tax=Longitalea luteola TaxID=2812563 RepID=UPI001A9701E7|nr:putative phage abortive infection protein [Longitalea luteola]
MKKITKNNIWVYIGAGISILLIIYCIIYIYGYYSHNNILWHYPKNYKLDDKLKKQILSPNEIGDSIGGILNPIIGLVASILTFLAFYMQKRANDDIQVQFKIQQFESQFYEMLRLHKENVTEIEIISFQTGISVSGRKAFIVMAQDYRALLSRAVLFESALTPADFEIAYGIFFWGYDEDEFQSLSSKSGGRVVGGNVASLSFIKEHQGYGSTLGHYFRHLFMMVKFVVNSSIVPEYKEKIKYLKILRAQLSNHEQIMLFYNWLSRYGAAWENNENQFFTEYVMIHNLWREELLQNELILKKVQELEKKPVRLRKKPLFEYQEKGG